MNAKSKVNFINSVASGQKIPCPSCTTLNKPDALFCITCGIKLPVNGVGQIKGETMDLKESRQQGGQGIVHEKVNAGKDENSGRQNPQPVTEDKKQAFRTVVSIASVEEGQISVFAQGLPAWDVVPPQIMVRRKRGR